MDLLIGLLVLCVVFGVIMWILSTLPIAQPWLNIARAVLALIFLIMLLNFIGWAGDPIFPHGHHYGSTNVTRGC